jgi:hypothetical protein
MPTAFPARRIVGSVGGSKRQLVGGKKSFLSRAFSAQFNRKNAMPCAS